MLKTLRTLTAVATLAALGLPQIASATLVQKTIDFEALAGDVVSGDVDLSTSNVFNTAAYGHATFSGPAFATDLSPGVALIAPCVPDCVTSPPADVSITVTIADLFHGDGGSMGLSLDVGNTSQLKYEIFDAALGLLKTGFFTPPNGNVHTVNIEFTGTAKYVTFTGRQTSFLIDNLSFSIDDNPTQPPTVPEPSSIALVALALAGVAGMARRREQR